MQYFNFHRLINKYKGKLTAITLSDGYYNESGDWVNGAKEETTIQGAIISFKESKVHRSEGTLTANDKRFFTEQPIGDNLYGVKAICNGKIYSIEDCTENANFTGIYAYTLKYISAFGDRPDDISKEAKRLDGVLND